jgi:hypothetical protein
MITTLILAAVPLINLLIWLLVFLVICYLVFLLIGLLPIDEPWKRIITIVVVLILLLVLIQQLGFI